MPDTMCLAVASCPPRDIAHDVQVSCLMPPPWNARKQLCSHFFAQCLTHLSLTASYVYAVSSWLCSDLDGNGLSEAVTINVKLPIRGPVLPRPSTSPRLLVCCWSHSNSLTWIHVLSYTGSFQYSPDHDRPYSPERARFPPSAPQVCLTSVCLTCLSLRDDECVCVVGD